MRLTARDTTLTNSLKLPESRIQQMKQHGSQYCEQSQDLPLRLVDVCCRGNPCGCPVVGQFSKIDISVSRYESRPTGA